jgi:hypothetical protein
MATWWEITFTGEPTGDDLAHVAELIPQGFTSGQLVNEPELCPACHVNLAEELATPDGGPHTWVWRGPLVSCRYSRTPHRP